MSGTDSKAASRIGALLDAGSFVEIGGRVTARNTDFNGAASKEASDGVVTGYGTVEGALVYVYSQDPDVLGGTIGEMHAKKIANIYRMAAKMGAPVVGLLDSKGLRLSESTDALAALGSIYRSMAKLSGVIPQIIGVFGNCGGGISLIPSVADFVFVEKSKARMFINSPDSIPGNNREICDTASAAYQYGEANADFIGTEAEIFAGMRDLLSVLPANNEDEGEPTLCTDDLNRATEGIKGYTADTLGILQMVSDGGKVIEVTGGRGRSMVTAFIKLNGTTIGAVTNRTQGTGADGETTEFGAKLCPCGVRKAAKFIRFCDAFGIPVLTIAQAEGFKSEFETESTMPKAAARLIDAYVNATVPKVTLNIGKSYGSASVILGSKAVGADIVYAWPDALIGTMDAKSAAKVMCGDADARTIAQQAKAYDELQQSVASAAARGYVDTVIDEASTRKYLIGAFEMLYTKREDLPYKKHTTV